MVLVFVADIVTKWVIEKNVADDQTIVVIKGFFEIIKVHNTGMAFSIGASGELYWRIIFIVISLGFSIGLSVYYAKQFKKLNTIKKVALAMIIGGAVGNLIDRSFYWTATTGFDGVIDFLRFYIFGEPFATFNVADASLVIGVIILIIVLIIELIKESIDKAKRGEYKMTNEEYMENLKKEEEASKSQNNE